jgi:hypothetical protein
MKFQKCLSLLIFFAAAASLPASANQDLSMPAPATMEAAKHKSFFLKSIDTGLSSNWSSSRPTPSINEYGSSKTSPGFTEIEFSVGDDGKIYEPAITHYSSDDQFDAECLEAICSLSPLSQNPGNETGFLEHHKIRFGDGSCLKPSFDGAEGIKGYATENPSTLHHRYILVHRIPLIVLTRYPGLFTKDELLATSNLIRFPVGEGFQGKPTSGQWETAPGYIIQVSNIYSLWAQLFHKDKLTRQEIENYSKLPKLYNFLGHWTYSHQ